MAHEEQAIAKRSQVPAIMHKIVNCLGLGALAACAAFTSICVFSAIFQIVHHYWH